MGETKKNRYFIIFLATILLFFSFLELRDVSFDILPEFQSKNIQVQTEALGLSASEVENLVTINVEEMLTNTPWLEKMESTSVNGLSSVDLTFRPDTDIMEARQMVSENLVLSQQIPNVSQETIILQPRSTTNRVMAVGLTSEELSLIDISELSRWNIRPALMSVSGVANVSIWGHRERQMQVQVDQEKIQYTGVSLDDVIKTTGNSFWMSNLTYLEASTPGSGGWIDTPNQRLEIQHILPINNENELARVSFPDRTYLTLGDVASVVEGHQPLIGDAVIGDGKGIMLVIEKYPWSSVVDVTSGVEEKLKDLKVGLKDIKVDTTVFRPASFVESMIDNLNYVFILGSILMLVGLGIFISKFRIAVFAFISIILSLITTFFVLDFYGNTFNTILIAGIIASVVIIVDQIINGLEKTKLGSVQSTLIAILLVSPVFFMGGESGLFYKPLAVSYVTSIISGLFFGLVVFPSLVKTFSNETKIENRNISIIKKIKKIYSSLLIKIMEKSTKVCALAVVLLTTGSLIWLYTAQYDLTPSYEERTLIVELENAPGTSLIEMNRVVTEISENLKKVDGIDNFGAHIGRAITGDQVTGVNSAQILVSINTDANYSETKEIITNEFNMYPEIIKGIRTYSQEIIDKHLVSSEDELFVRVYGPNFEKLQVQAEEVKSHISRVDGVINPRTAENSYVEVPGIEIEVNVEKANRYGLKPGDIRRTAATLVNGLEVANRFEEQKVYQVAVWSVPEERRDIEDIKNILIDTPGGGLVRLQDVADVKIVPMMGGIEREGMSRYVDITFESRGNIKEMVKGLEEQISEMEFDLEYHAAVLGEYEENNNGFLLVISFVIIGIFLLLHSVFNSWRLSILSLVIAPAALTGGILGIYILDSGIVSLGSLVGLIIVLAMTYRNSIATISHYKSLKQNNEFTKLDDTADIIRGSKDRFIPIIMSTIIYLFILLPLLIAGSISGLEIGYSATVVILTGMVSSILVNIFVVPKLYLWISNKDYNYEE